VGFVRVWAAAALARVEPENAYAIPALLAGTRDGTYFVRSLAAWHLGRLGPRHPGIEAVMPELRELLNDNDSASSRTEVGWTKAAFIIVAEFALATGLIGRNLHFVVHSPPRVVQMALVAVLCWKCSHIGFARADALPRVLVCSRCHRQQRFEPRPPRQRLTDREEDLQRDIEQAIGTEN
jgi:hypothetical protein